MITRTFSATLRGIEGQLIEVQTASDRGTPRIQITGLPGPILKESQDRLKVCLQHLGFDVPSGRLMVHLLPATAPKHGAQLDLAVAIGALVSEDCFRGLDVGRIGLLGELGLDGELKSVAGALSLIQALDVPEIDLIIVPADNAWEASLLGSDKVKTANNLMDVVAYLQGKQQLNPVEPSVAPEFRSSRPSAVVGHGLAKRALQIAIAGRHHILMIGPPGVGKTMLAHSIQNSLPPLSREEMVEVVKVRLHKGTDWGSPWERPFRAPHHSISTAALLGGGSGTVVPGEVSLAHCGVLFMDEFPEFKRTAIEGLREAVQNREISLHRVGAQLKLPARFTLIAAMNPCPCGYAQTQKSLCRCTRDQISNYQKRISGPILDRFDLLVRLSKPVASAISETNSQKDVAPIQAVQQQRYSNTDGVSLNGDLEIDSELDDLQLGRNQTRWLEVKAKDPRVSFRKRFKLIKVARTIADLEGEASIQLSHLEEAWALHCPQELQFYPF